MRIYFSTDLEIDEYEGVHLVQDHIGTFHKSPWDDFDYVVTFNVYRVLDGESDKVGLIKLLVKGEMDTSKYFTENGKKIEADNIYDVSELLVPSTAVSLACDVDFYKKLRKILSYSEIETYLINICDAGYFYQNYDVFKQWPGFGESLFRESSVSEAVMRKGYQIAMGNYSPPKQFEMEINSLPDSFEKVDFYFDSERETGKLNINLVIGKNGCGKTYLLKHLTEILTGLKRLDNSYPFFHKLLVVAYSPFESFYTKNELIELIDRSYFVDRKKRRANKKQKSNARLMVNEYSYIGFKNNDGRFDLNWPKEQSARSVVKVIKYDEENNWWNEKGRFDVLVETLKLSLDFDHIRLLLKRDEFVDLIGDDIPKIESIENDIDFEAGIYFVKNGKVLKLSSGQMIYSYMLPALVAEISDESLVIVDEPELYLHPSLEIGLIEMMQHLLSETSSYAIIATHSAILAREVPQKGVKIFRSIEGSTQITKPSFETFGESVELIMGEVFNDYSTKKPYQKRLDALLEENEASEELIKDISPNIGNEALSYLLSTVDDKLTEDIVFEDNE